MAQVKYLRTAIILCAMCAAWAAAMTWYSAKHRRQYEQLVLSSVYRNIAVGQRLRAGQVEDVLERNDLALGRYVIGLSQQPLRINGQLHALWSVKRYFNEHGLIQSPELKSLFAQIPDAEPGYPLTTVSDR